MGSWGGRSSDENDQRIDDCAPSIEVDSGLAADDIKRLSRRPTTIAEARFDWLDDAATERPEWIAAFLELKTVWHPIGG